MNATLSRTLDARDAAFPRARSRKFGKQRSGDRLALATGLRVVGLQKENRLRLESTQPAD
jgi:hypothetical protein